MDGGLARPADVPIWILAVFAVVVVNVVGAAVLLAHYAREPHGCR
jgi:hypothetical protein